ncbi:hypothetical protein PFICI_01695 [Pestalotiopsis fici W106-1]|uniref:Xylanolytic transcriptional activator regulatory domain-containing protein n=1 Tax=Pestalotiopsis fici (strain W106-1 / CGMCC3.15140) TaxID=1229662 RepID=W3XQS7_PESFW|nr:uncharacterized protein PFICI_01695 [Pestalotiopsis fici W106-1]ETS87867.1 hypothetical protein PFICI_01695 [Pestalotiopsis fici W106-1]
MVNFTFVPQDNPDGRSRRLRNRTACDRCRMKKRRCYHQRQSTSNSSEAPATVESVRDSPDRPRKRFGNSQPHPGHDWDDSESPSVNTGTSTNLPRGTGTRDRRHTIPDTRPLSPPNRLAQSSSHVAFDANESDASPRFVGDLNPEARLIDGSTPSEEMLGTSPGMVGVWVHAQPHGRPSPLARNIAASTHVSSQSLQQVPDFIRIEDLLALTNLYFADIHPIIPLLNEQEFRTLLTRNSVPVPLLQVVCLLAAKHHAAAPHLRLSPAPEQTLSVRAFCSKLYHLVTSSLSGKTSLKKITLIRVLGLLSLHHEGRDGAEESSSHIAQAIHHAQTLALHLHRPSDEGYEMKRLFWCLWTLDRLNSAIHSRPCLINDIDTAIEPLTPAESGSVAFDIWFRISKMLSTAIGLYRPTNDASIVEVDLEYHGFEQLVEECRGCDLSPSTLATLRIFFLAAAIISHRLKTIQNLPSVTPARLRQQLSSIQIIRYMKDENRINSLHPLPVVVYAASLALSVFYQHLRYSRIALEQEEAHQDFNTACSILQALQRKWSAADAMASLAQKVSTELKKLPSFALLQIEREEPHRNNNQESEHDLQALGPSAVNEHPNSAAAPDQQGGHMAMWRPDGIDLFGGMDDMSWMYLDPQNPVSFDSLPFTDWDAVFAESQEL